MNKVLVGVLSLMSLARVAVAQQPVAVRRAEEEPARTAVRVNGIVQGFDFVGVGVEVSHSHSDSFATEASVAAVDLQRGYAGTYGQVLWRAGVTGGRHNLNLGVGPGLLHSGAFGWVGFIVPEVAYEFRLRDGLSLAVGLGLPVTLNDSRDVPCQDSGWFACAFERTQFKAGEFMPRARVALGYSF